MTQRLVNNFWKSSNFGDMVKTFELIPDKHKVSLIFYLMRNEMSYNKYFSERLMQLSQIHKFTWCEFSSKDFWKFFFNVTGASYIFINVLHVDSVYLLRRFPKESDRKKFIQVFDEWYYNIEESALVGTKLSLELHDLEDILHKMRESYGTDMYTLIFKIAGFS